MKNLLGVLGTKLVDAQDQPRLDPADEDVTSPNGQDFVPAPPASSSQKKPCARILIVEGVYHQQCDRNPTGGERRYGRTLECSARPVEIDLTVTEEWQPLPVTHLKSVGMLLLVNEEGRFTRNPTSEERRLATLKVVEISGENKQNPWLVLPGESFRGSPTDHKTLHVRCRSGSAECVLTYFPG